MLFWLVYVVAFIATWLLTGLVREYAIKRSLLDIPGDRSSHQVPTPRGGGVAIVLAFSACAAWFQFAGGLSSQCWLAVLGAGLITAAIGFLDDHGHIAARWRLLGHFAAAGSALLLLDNLPFSESFRAVGLMWGLYLLAALFLVWMLNLYNFMDGIDGIASVQAISVCAGASLLYYCTGHALLGVFVLPLAACVLGFLCWNFPPAKIFMGDAGSGFLGVVLGVLALYAGSVASVYFWAWLILMGVFIVDATFTLFRRFMRGEKIYQAHRRHGYQFAARRHGAHMSVTLGVMAINLCWLLPIGFLVVQSLLNPVLGVIIAYLPVLWLAVKYGAGAEESKAAPVGP